nr:integrase [Vibrio diabolicus]
MYANSSITDVNVNVSYSARQRGHSDITMVAKVYGKWLKESDRVCRSYRRLRGIESLI